MTGIIPELQKMFDEVTQDHEPDIDISDQEYLLITLKYPAMQHEIFRMWLASDGYWPNQMHKDSSLHVRKQIYAYEHTELYSAADHDFPADDID